MRTLLDRLKTEHKEQFKAMLIEYPTLHEGLYLKLRGNVSILQLTIESAATLLIHTSKQGLSYENLENLFEE